MREGQSHKSSGGGSGGNPDVLPNSPRIYFYIENIWNFPDIFLWLNANEEPPPPSVKWWGSTYSKGHITGLLHMSNGGVQRPGGFRKGCHGGGSDDLAK